MYGPVDSLLEAVRGGFASAPEAAAAILGTVFRLNEEIARIVNEEEKERRVRQWVEQLLEGITMVTKAHPAMTYSVSVGWPPSVTVSVGWASESEPSGTRARPTQPDAVRIPDHVMASDQHQSIGPPGRSRRTDGP